MINSGNTTVMVSSIKKSVEFYTKVLGLQAGMRHGDDYAEVKAPGLIIGLHLKRRLGTMASRDGNLFIGFRVSDVDKAAGELRKKGLDEIEFQENEVGKLAFFADPDGTPLYLIQMK